MPFLRQPEANSIYPPPLNARAHIRREKAKVAEGIRASRRASTAAAAAPALVDGDGEAAGVAGKLQDGGGVGAGAASAPSSAPAAAAAALLPLGPMVALPAESRTAKDVLNLLK